MKDLRMSVLAKLFLAIALSWVCMPGVAADHNIWPERVTDMTVTEDSSTGHVVITLTAPTHSMTSLGDGNGEPLPYLTKIVLSRNLNYGDYIEIHTFENPAPGEQLTYIDATAIAGLYQYKAVAYVDDYASYPEWSEIEVGQFAMDINDAVATCNKGEAPVTLMFTAPSTDTKGEPLRALSYIEVSRYSEESYSYEVLGKIDNPTPGSACTYDDYDVVSGSSYSYRLICYTAAGSSYGTLVNVMVGLDAPVAPGYVEAELLSDGKVMITWLTPTVGQTNGYIDPMELKYTILRSATGSEYESEVVASNVSDWYYVDETIFTEEAKLTYFVRASNAQGESVGAASNPIVVGNPSALPYVECFDSKTTYGVATTDHPGWTYSSSETTCAWYINDVVELENRTITTADENGGMAFALYGSYNDLQQDDYMTTGKIALGYTDVFAIAFDYYAFTGSNSTLSVEVSADGKEFKEVALIEYEAMPQEGWERSVIYVTEYEYKMVREIQVRLHAHKGTHAMPVIIDNFVVTEIPQVRNVVCDYENHIISWEAPDNKFFEPTGYQISLNGTDMGINEPDNTSYDYSKFADEYFLTFAIYALYDNIWSEAVIVDLTAVENVELSPVKIDVRNRVLYVDVLPQTPVAVYSLDGMAVHHTEGAVELPLSQGVYIVQAGTEVRKVVVE